MSAVTPNLQNNSSSKWLNVDARNVCKTCGKPDWCAYTEDHGAWICRRMGDVGAIARQDKSGEEYWLHFAEKAAGPRTSEKLDDVERNVPKEEAAKTPTATRAERHAAYTALLGALTLSAAHKAALGLDATKLEALGYRSTPTDDEMSRAVVAIKKVLPKDAGDLDWLRIPGVKILHIEQKKLDAEGKPITKTLSRFRKGADGRDLWVDGKRVVEQYEEFEMQTVRRPRLHCVPGFFVPVRDADDYIVALRIRKDDETNGKYMSLRGTEAGAAAERAAHVALMALPEDRRAEWYDVVRLTEGEKKADIATLRSGILTVGIPSVNAWRLSEEPISKLRPKKIIVSFDADGRRNPGVAGSWSRAVMHYLARGYEVSAEIWDHSLGKGIDDVLSSGFHGPLRELSGLELLQEIRSWLAAAGAPVAEELDARIVIEAVRGEMEANPDAVCRRETLRAVAVLSSTHNGHKIEDKFSTIAANNGDKTKFARLLKEEVKRLRDEASAAKKQERAELAEARGQVVFERGDGAELAQAALRKIEENGRVVFDQGALWQCDPETKVWREVGQHEVSVTIQNFAGSVIRGSNQPLRISGTDTTISMAYDRAAKPRSTSP